MALREDAETIDELDDDFESDISEVREIPLDDHLSDSVPPPDPEADSDPGLEMLNEQDLRDDLFSIYLRDACQYPLLTKEEEHALGVKISHYRNRIEPLKERLEEESLSPRQAKKIKKKITILESRVAPYINELIAHNLRLVVSVARRNQGRGMQMMDLIQEGNMGMARAAYKFDVDKGYRFSTYAMWWIRQAMTRAIADKARDVRLPVHMHDAVSQLNRFAIKFQNKHGRYPTLEDVMDHFKIPEKKARLMMENHGNMFFSLNAPIKDEEGGTFMNLMHDPDEASPDQSAVDENITEIVAKILENLTPRERQVIKLRFGLDADRGQEDGLTLKEIGVEFNLTRERIRQLQEQALTKLRKVIAKHLLPEDFDY